MGSPTPTDTVVVHYEHRDPSFDALFNVWLGQHLNEIRSEGAGIVVIESENGFPWDHHLITALDETSKVVLVYNDPDQYFLMSEAYYALEAQGVHLVELIKITFEVTIEHRFERIQEV